MKINFFSRYLIPERISIEKVFSVVQTELQKKSFEVEVFTNPYSLSKIWKAMWFFKNHQGDINHITGDIHWASLLLNPKKTILTIHDCVGAEAYNSVFKNMIYRLLWIYLPVWKLKYITVISQKTKDELLKYCPNAEAKIRIIHNPLTAELYRREVLDKKSEDMQLLLVGTRANKNIEYVLKATANLTCNIVIVGETDDLQNILIKNSKANILVKSFVSDEELNAIYRNSDVLIFPSLYEGFGMPIIEAQAAGCAVITSNIEPMLSVAADAAVFVEPLDIDGIKREIEILINDLNLRKDLVKKGYQNAARFLPEAITQQYINLYKEIANEAGIID